LLAENPGRPVLTLLRWLSVPALALIVPWPALADPAALAVGQAWCAAVRGSDEAAAEALMTPDLKAAVARVRSADAAFRTAYPSDKPPLGDGLRLTAFPDGLESCTPEAATARSVDLVFAPGSDPAATWRGRLVLVAGPSGGLLVADVLYAPEQAVRFSDWLTEAASWK
jgi:hypothetical protein